MAKNYDYTLETTKFVHIEKIKHLFEEFDIPYSFSTYLEGNTKIYEISYSEDDIEDCVNMDEFLDLLEDLAIRYRL